MMVKHYQQYQCFSQVLHPNHSFMSKLKTSYITIDTKVDAASPYQSADDYFLVSLFQNAIDSMSEWIFLAFDAINVQPASVMQSSSLDSLFFTMASLVVERKQNDE